jgi:surface polysaccharide O-acyltransferase-like enzyme
MILLIHVTAAYYYFHDQQHVFSTLALNQFCRYSICLFMLISGFLLFYHNNGKKYDTRKYWRSRTSKVVIPFVICTIFYQCITYATVGISPIFLSSQYFYQMIFLGKGFYHLWFLSVMIQFYTLFPLLQRFATSKKRWNILLVLACIIQLLFLKLLPHYLNWEKVYVFNWIFYFVIGGYFAQYWQGIKNFFQRRTLITILCFLIVLADGIWSLVHIHLIPEYRIENMIIVPIFFFGLIGAYPILKQIPKNEQWINTIGTYSMGIYLIHPLFIYYAEWLPAFFWHPSATLLTTALYLMICIWSLKGLEKVPYYQYFIPIPKQR